MGRTGSSYDEGRGVCSFLVWKAGRMRSLDRPRRRRVDNNEMDFQEIGCGFKDWIVVVHDRDRWRTLVNAVMNFGGP
jgi:hypothetical protein